MLAPRKKDLPGWRGAIGGGTPPVNFSVKLDEEAVTTWTGYALDAVLVSGKREYMLRLSLALTDNASPMQAFQSGQTFALAEIFLWERETAALLRTYALTNATVVAYRQSADDQPQLWGRGSSSGPQYESLFRQELVLRSKSLTIG